MTQRATTMNGPVSLEQAAKQARYNCLIYGGTGVGKTVFACSSQRRRTLLLDIDRGWESAANWPQVRRDLVYVWTISSFPQFVEAMKWCDANHSYFDLIVVDTATELQRLVLSEICAQRKHVLADKQDWGYVLNVMRDCLHWMRTLPPHCIWTAHETSREDQETGMRFWYPAFQGQLADKYGIPFGVIGRYLMIQQQERRDDKVVWTSHRGIKFARDPNTDAKDRSNRLTAIEPPNLDAILDKLESAFTDDKEIQSA